MDLLLLKVYILTIYLLLKEFDTLTIILFYL